MTSGAPQQPADAVSRDAKAERAPDPRQHYGSPEELREDVNVDLAEREELLRQWKLDLDNRLAAEAEGMSASDPMRAETEARLAAEARRVTKALEDIVSERART